MNKKIMPIVVCMLFLIPITISAQSIDKERPLMMVTYEESAPTWSEGDSWTYDVSFSGGTLDVLGFELAFSDLKLTVDSVTSSEYNVNVEGDVTGEISLNKFQIIKGKITDTTITGNAVYSTSNIGIKELDVQIIGKFQLIPGEFVIDVTLSFNPAYNIIQWPVSVGEEWNIPVSDIEGNLDLTYAGEKLFDDVDVPNILGGQPVKRTDTQPMTVDAGTFDAYKIEGVYEDIEMYYAADAGNLIYVTVVSDECNLEMVLTSTTYSGGGTPGAPNTPSKPSGSTNIKTGQECVYSSSTTDNEGDQIYYRFDWDDDSDSGWIGPFDSGAKAEAIHSWSSKGSYNVRVKAKDTADHESSWSDPLLVSIPKSRSYINTAFMQFVENFFERYPNLFPMLQTLIQRSRL